MSHWPDGQVLSKVLHRAGQPLGFALVGCAGFATDACLFLLLSQVLAVPVFAARALAFVPATGVTCPFPRLAGKLFTYHELVVVARKR